ncbi:MAG TPA: LmeA family phospholipid-binding protein [Trebonia sp.]|nr:LmeA family phospholipid-binding protein [Trebonia sp.]
MSTDETQPARPPSPGSPQAPRSAPAEARPAFQGQYQRSVEPRTVPVERPLPPAGRQEQSPYGRPPAGSSSSAEPGWPERPPQQEATQQFGATQQYGSSGYGPGEPGYGGQPPGAGPSTYDPASYGRPGSGSGYGPPAPAGRRRRRRRPVIMSVLAVVVILILLVIGDRVAKAVAENDIANQIKSGDSQINPSVNIPGFPFLTQVIAHDINEIDISASNVPAGPITITSVNAVAKGVHINGSFNGGKVDSVTATVFVGFGSVSSALSSQGQGIAGLTLASAGPDKIKATVSFAGVAAITETGTVTMKGNQVTISFPAGGGGSGGGIAGAISSALGSGDSLPDLSFTIPKLPAGLQVASLNVTSQGIMVNAVAHNTTLSE